MAGTQGRQLADGLLEPAETKKRKVGSTTEEKQQEVGSSIGGTPPPPLRCPPYPKTGKRKGVAEWNRECRRISALAAKDPRRSLPTLVKPKDPKTADSVESPRDKALVREAARSLVLEEPEYLDLNYLMHLSCEDPMYGIGGPVVDHDDGRVVGISSVGGTKCCTVLGISTILTCIEMWTKFGRIAHPAHGLCLRTMELLEVSLQERIFLDHGITSGYIVNRVPFDSTAERLGIRYGDVIVSFNGLRHHTLPQLEDYLLSLGWAFLNKSINESSATVDLKLEVYDLLGRTTRSITLPVEFSDG